MTVAQHLEGRLQELRHNAGARRHVAAHEVVQHIHGKYVFSTAFMLGDDLQKILAGQVVAGLQIDDLHLSALTNETRDILKRDVVAGLGVIKAAAGVALDQKGFFSISHGLPPYSERCTAA